MRRRGVRVLPVFGRDELDADGSVRDTRMLYRYLRQFDALSLPHTIGMHAGPNFADYAPDVDPVVEIYQGCRNAYEYPGCPRGVERGNEPGFLWNLLEAGKRYGVISSSDHHSTHLSYGMLFVEEATREGVMDAFRRRHCYAATDNILLDVRLNGRFLMGDEVDPAEADPGGRREFSIRVVGTAPLRSVVMIRNAEIVHELSPDGAELSVRWIDSAPPDRASWYYVRVIQTDGEIAWGSPIWVR